VGLCEDGGSVSVTSIVPFVKICEDGEVPACSSTRCLANDKVFDSEDE
jgi:hypothetical protein